MAIIKQANNKKKLVLMEKVTITVVHERKGHSSNRRHTEWKG